MRLTWDSADDGDIPAIVAVVFALALVGFVALEVGIVRTWLYGRATNPSAPPRLGTEAPLNSAGGLV